MGRLIVLAACTLTLTIAASADSPAHLNAREFQVAGSPMVVRVWDQDDTGVMTPYWSVAFDGATFSPAQSTRYEIPLRYATFDPAAVQPVAPGLFRTAPDTHLYLVQYYTQPFAQYRDAIRALGGVDHFFVPNNADLVTVPDADALAQIAALPFVRAVAPYEPAYRVDPAILSTLQLDGTLARYSIQCVERGPTEQNAIAAIVLAAGGTVHFTQPADFRMEVTCDPVTLLLIARSDHVNCVEPWPGPGEPDMNIARGPAGFDADFIDTTYGYDGQGVRGEVFDTGVRATHQAFQNPSILFHTRNGSSTFHGTSTYGEVFGNGAANPLGTGMLPGREQGIFADYLQVTQFGGTKTRSQHTLELVDPNGPYRSVFQTSSVGSNTTTQYTTISAEVDDYLWRYDLLSCQSQSNTGSQLSRPQAWAKNIVSVGGFYHYDNTNRADDRWSSGASVGPASDGRIKPDLAAYYDMVLTTSDSCDTCYTTDFSGTSSATPMTAGAFGLLYQMWHMGVWAGHGGGASVFADRMHMATAKALAINSAYLYKCAAADSGQPGAPAFTDLTRTRQGWGMLNLHYANDQAALTTVIDQSDLLTPLQTNSYHIVVASAQPALKVTMVYTDPPGNPNVQTQHRVNDLDLIVTAPDGQTIYRGNSGLSTSSWSSSGGTSDTKNTVENVFVQNPAAGQWLVQVRGTQIVQDSHRATPEMDADYALVIYGGHTFPRGDLNCDGVVTFDDINPFVLALVDPALYQQTYPNCDLMNGDCNNDGVLNFDDINAFVALLGGFVE